MTGAQLRSSAASFRTATAAGYDGLAPGHLALLSDQALDVLASILTAVEQACVLPRALRPVRVALIPKKTSAWRGIGVYHAVLRTYTRARLPVCQAWERSVVEPFLAQGRKTTPLDPIWRLAARAEAATRESGFAAVAAFDVAAFFESLDWRVLWQRAVEENFPLPILRMALTLYAAPRHVGADGVVGCGWHPRRGIAPGCPWAMALAKLYAVGPFRRIAAAHPQAQLTLFVDDVVVATDGKRETEVRAVLVDACADVLHAIGTDLEATVAEAKSVVVASSEQLAAGIQRDLQLPASSVASATVLLGGEASAGRPRRKWSRQAGRSMRVRRVMLRVPRVRAFRAAAGRAAAGLAKTGLMPAAAHAAEVFGASDAELLRLQRIAAAAQSPSAQGRSLTALRLVRGDPAERAAIAPLLRWCREVWDAARGVPSAHSLSQLRGLWVRASPGSVRKWAHCCGPMGAAVLSAKRIGWRLRGPFAAIDRNGRRLNFTQLSPALLQKLALRDWQAATEEKLGRHWRRGCWSWGVDDPRQNREVAARVAHIPSGGPAAASPPSALVIREALASRKWSSQAKGALAAVATDAVWTRERLARAGYAAEATCTLCGVASDTMHHRAWVCPCSAAVRNEHATPDQIRRARAAGNESPLWSAGWLPRPRDLVPPPGDMDLWQWTPGGGEEALGSLAELAGVMSRAIFTDGSCSTQLDPERRRAGWAVVEVGEELIDGKLVKLRAVWGTIPSSWPQSSQAAEFAAAVAAAELIGDPQAKVYSDCKGVVDAFRSVATIPLMDVLRPQHLWAGALRTTLAFERAAAPLRGMEKVPAHTAAYAGEPPQDRHRRLANAWADELAKKAAKCHETMSPLTQLLVDQALADARTACKVLAEATLLWPSAAAMVDRARRPTTRAGRVAAARAQHDAAVARKALRATERARRRRTHQWLPVGSRRRCGRCLLAEAAGIPECDGFPAKLEEWGEAAADFGHVLLHAALYDDHVEEALPSLVCLACGAWTVATSHAARSGLLAPCKRGPTRAGKDALARVGRGRHPKAGRKPPLLASLGRWLPRRSQLVG